MDGHEENRFDNSIDSPKKCISISIPESVKPTDNELPENAKTEPKKMSSTDRLKQQAANVINEGMRRPIPDDNKGYQLLVKMGYKNGNPIGTRGDGLVEPITYHFDPLKRGRPGFGTDKTSSEASSTLDENRPKRKKSKWADPEFRRQRMELKNKNKIGKYSAIEYTGKELKALDRPKLSKKDTENRVNIIKREINEVQLKKIVEAMSEKLQQRSSFPNLEVEIRLSNNEENISDNLCEEVKDSLLQTLFVYEGPVVPRFLHIIKATENGIRILCANEFSLQWLEQTVLGELSKFNLKIVSLVQKIVNPVLCMMIFCQTINDTQAFRFLQQQNPDLKTDLWIIEKSEGLRRNAKTLHVWIDDRSLQFLSTMDFRPYFGFGRIQISPVTKKYNKIEKKFKVKTPFICVEHLRPFISSRFSN